MLVLAKGGIFRRYATVSFIGSDQPSSTGPRYHMTWGNAMANVGYFGHNGIQQRVYVWNHLHKNWYHVMTK